MQDMADSAEAGDHLVFYCETLTMTSRPSIWADDELMSQSRGTAPKTRKAQEFRTRRMAWTKVWPVRLIHYELRLTSRPAIWPSDVQPVEYDGSELWTSVVGHVLDDVRVQSSQYT